MLTSGKIAMADLAGADAILKAMASDEEDTITACERGSQQSGISQELREICGRAHQDELRHREWMLSATEGATTGQGTGNRGDGCARGPVICVRDGSPVAAPCGTVRWARRTTATKTFDARARIV